MNKVLDRIVFNPLVFKVAIIIVLFVSQVPFVHLAIGSYIKYLLFLGILDCAWDIYRHGVSSKIFDAVFALLIAFVCLYAITVFVNREFYLTENLKQLIYMAVFFWLFTMLRDENVKYDILIVSLVVIGISALLSILSLLTYFLNIHEWYILPNGSDLNYIGISNGKLFGMYNANSCGMIATVSLIASLFFLTISSFKKRIVKLVEYLLIGVNVVVQYLVLLLSHSRGSFYAFIFTMVITTFLFVIMNVNKGIAIKFTCAFLASVLVFFVLIEISGLIQEKSDALIFVSDSDSWDVEKDSFFENALETALKKYYENTSALSGNISGGLGRPILQGIGRNESGLLSTSGRLSLWKAGVKVFVENPIFGITREGIKDKTSEILNETPDDLVGGGLHNMYLTILVSSGIVGFVTIGAAVIIVLIKFLKVLFLKAKANNYLLFSFAMVFAFLISEFVENRILYQVTAFNAVFWIYFGYLYFFAKKALKEESNGFSLNKTE